MLLALFTVQHTSTCTMVKKDHIKDLCGSNRARKLEKCASFEFFSSQLTENKAVAGRQKKKCHLHNMVL